MDHWPECSTLTRGTHPHLLLSAALCIHDNCDLMRVTKLSTVAGYLRLNSSLKCRQRKMWEGLGEWTLGEDKTVILCLTQCHLCHLCDLVASLSHVSWSGGNWSNENWSHDTESEQSGYIHLLYCSSDGKLKVEGTSARIGQCTRRIMTGAGFDMVCWAFPTPCWWASYSSIFVPLSSLFTLGRESPSIFPFGIILHTEATSPHRYWQRL